LKTWNVAFNHRKDGKFLTTGYSTLQTILSVTELLISKKGCRQTTLQDIVRESGLSKGAIFHYVSSKDELLGLILKSRVEQMNNRFTEIVNHPRTAGLADPLELIAEGMMRTSSHEDVSNKIFVHLLSPLDNAKVAEIVQDVYTFTLKTCTRWIDIGKLHGVIPPIVDSESTAEELVLFMYGLRIQNTVTRDQGRHTVQNLAAFLIRSLQYGL
jgi:AcrR family transcriptional regulator